VSAEKSRKGKQSKPRERIIYHVNAGHINDHLTPAQATAEGCQEAMGKAAAGNPYSGAVDPDDRLSEPLTAGHQAPSTGDHGVGAGRSSEIAYNHPDLRQGSTTIKPWQTLRLQHQSRPDAEIVWGAGRVDVQQLHTGEAGDFTSQPSGNPNVRPLPHSARNSATQPNGGHGLGNVTSHAVAAKAESNLDIMRRTQKVMGSDR
jgi:hypothetical protein